MAQRVTPPVQRHRILVVDGHLDSVQSMAHLLHDMGHEVEFAISAPAALEATRRFRPQVVFLDPDLQQWGGMKLAQLMRREPGMAAARILPLDKPLDLAHVDGLLQKRA
jgi:CheY-like chemotaxis protein